MTEKSPFRAPMTFMGVPHATSPGAAKAAVLGLPFDCGDHPQRVGSRLGPFAIREQSQLLRRWDGDSGIDPLHALGVVDLGDADVVSGDVDHSYRVIEQAMDLALSGGALSLAFGGDGAIALPQMRALARRHPDLAVLHVDAHTDAYPIDGYNNATPFARAFQESLIDPQCSFHVGTRRSTMVPGVCDYGRQLGYGIVTMDQLMAQGIRPVFERIAERIGSRPVYLCFDMDFFDPSVAPGVCTPAWGGASAREGLELIRYLKGLNIVAIDINTISPPHDVGGMSALLAATLAFELLVMAAKGDFAAPD